MKLAQILHQKLRTADSEHRYRLLPSTSLEERCTPTKHSRWWSRSCNITASFRGEKEINETTAYLDGMRGLAAFVVYIEHFSLPYQNGMLIAYGSPGATSYWQLPVVRLLYSGTPMVSIFFVVSGCALSLKVLRMARSGDHSAAFKCLSSSIFRRGIRLFAPTTIATFVVMLLTQSRLYEFPYPILEIHGRRHMVLDRPPRLASFWLQFVDWIRYLFARLYYPETWMGSLPNTTTSIYASQLWTIPVEFYASMTLYICLAGLIAMRSRIRRILLITLAAFALAVDRWDIVLFFAGAAIAESVISLDHKSKDYKISGLEIVGRGSAAVPHAYAMSMLLTAALVLLSYPDHEARTNPLYHFLAAVSDNHRQWQSLGATLLLFSCSRMHWTRDLFSCALMRYLGRISYGLYVVHIPVLASYGWAVVPLIWRHVTGDDTWWAENLGFTLGIIILTPFVLLLATLWTEYIDQPCQKLAKWLESKARERED